ncbi:MAG TPA: ComEC family competence protein [Candidatus Nealsonbacteria bacterium]|uniref:ComEC/Rec2-related protein domain-containing protein n=1 Tax=marine sediment metagenome TaxID=412755 RepID=A0A0F9UJQ6_9ZZZZ|nr:ComEC family competence protein [Candidatus Nealsonbacteria bacterium]HEB46454.1 ComEC family competence protein [Candidatus Nealsonbacteria bacterium]
MTQSRIFFYFCLAFIGGIFINSLIYIPQLLMLGIVILGILLISVFWTHKKIVIIGFCILFLVAGAWRHQAVELKIANNELRIFNDRKETVTLAGIITTEPDVREKSIKLTIDNLTIETEVGPLFVNGKVLVTISRYPEYEYGDKLKIAGKLETPQQFEDFNYKDYLKKDGIYSVMYFPEIEVIEKDQGNFLYAKILSFKNKLRESIYRNLSPPQSSILGAMVLGDKRKMSDDLKEKLNIVGVRHITAVSGLHVAILASILMTLLIGLGFWRQQAFYFSIVLIALFIIMTGLQSSAIRAGIMAGLFLLAQHVGRMNTSSRTIVFAAAVMLVLNPLLLRLDVGFQLSFLAMMGIIYLLPIFREWLRFIPEERFFNLRSILAMTLSAQIFTLPILVYNFGRMSLVGVSANILIVPLLYWIMIFGFISALIGIFWQPLGWILSWPAWFLLNYVTKIVDWFSQIPLASLTLEISWIWLIISYLILVYFIWRLQEKQKLRFLNY